MDEFKALAESYWEWLERVIAAVEDENEERAAPMKKAA